MRALVILTPGLELDSLTQSPEIQEAIKMESAYLFVVAFVSSALNSSGC